MVFLGDIRKILLLLVLIAVSKANDVGWYQSFLSERIAPMYVNAYRILKDKIVNPILAYKVEDLTINETKVMEVVSLAERLTCATKELYSSLSTALNASEQLNSAVGKRLSEIMSAISQKENEVQQANNQLSIVTARLTDAQAQVNQADNDVRNKENELASADGQLAEEQRKLDRARHCGIRKKRFLKKLWNSIKNNIIKPIVRPFCAVLNYGGINRAKDRRGAAQGAVNAGKEQLANRRQELERQRSEFNKFQDQKSQATTNLHTLSANLAQLQTRQTALANMTQEIRKVVMHLTSFMSKSSVLYDELKSLVSFELLVQPLNAILTDLINSGVTTRTIAGAIQISSVEINIASDTLDLIKAQLPSLPLEEDYSNTC